MTLVVARIIEKQIVILSDTKITSPGEILQGLDNHILKAVIINPNLCICYAQTIRKALKALTELEIRSVLNLDLESIQAFLLEKHQNWGNDPDFIIASLIPHPSLHKISDGRLISIPATWLGNQDAFNYYQQYYEAISKIRDIPLNVSTKMYSAFTKVSALRKYDDIGEFTIEVKNDEEGFKYFQSASGVNAVRLNGKGVFSSVAHKTARDGGYTYSVFAPKKAGIGAVGIHFYQGKLGVLFYPIQQEKPKIYADVTVDQFKLKVFEEFGFEIAGDTIVEK